MTKKVSLNDSGWSHTGCWYCHQTDDKLVLSREWDSPVHIVCIYQRIKFVIEQHDPEVEVFIRELGLLKT